jgi:hypothetical protein
MSCIAPGRGTPRARTCAPPAGSHEGRSRRDGETEDVVDQAGRRAGRQSVLKRAEIGHSVRVDDDYLAIEQGGLHLQPRQLTRNGLEARSPIEVVAADEPNGLSFDRGEDAIAVELDLVEPAVAGGRLVDQRRERRPNRSPQRCRAGARNAPGTKQSLLRHLVTVATAHPYSTKKPRR